MSSKQTSQDLLEVITRTPLRQRVLDTLSATPMTMRDLSAHLDISKSTVKHNLSVLREADLVVETRNREYRPTPLGRVVSNSFDEFLERIEMTAQFDPAFQYIPFPPDTDPIVFRNADMTVSSREVPHAAARRLTEIIVDGTNITGIVPIIPPLSPTDANRLFETTESIDIISTRAVSEMLHRNYGPDLDEQHAEIAVTDDLPFGLLIVDSTVVLQGLDDGRKTHVLLESDTSECLAWGREVISHTKERSCTTGY